MKFGNIQPAIKWSGSKRSQAKEIIGNHFPVVIDTYYEPFCGGLSIGINLALADNLINRFVCSDLDQNLISLWNTIKNQPDELFESYTDLWHQMVDGSNGDVSKMQVFYNNVRDRFNESHDPMDFMFLNRTCFNGLVRYNSKGDFNSPFHLNRKGIDPVKLGKIIHEWSEILNRYNFEFRCCDFSEISPSNDDFVYLDPPYANTKGMYGPAFERNRLFDWMQSLPCPYAMSYDGVSGDDDHTFDVPEDLYDRKLYIKSGNSSFKRLRTEKKHSDVYESLYIKIDKNYFSFQ